MTASPAGCGVLLHAPECLCDVVLAEPIPIRAGLTLADYDLGPAVAAYRGYDLHEVEGERLIDVLDHLARAVDAFSAIGYDEALALVDQTPETPPEKGGEATRIKSTKGSIAFVRKYADSPLSNGELRAETNRIFGTQITYSHMNHMRKRYGGTNL